MAKGSPRKRSKSGIRRIDGENWRMIARSPSERDARSAAVALREGYNGNAGQVPTRARVIKSSRGWGIWVPAKNGAPRRARRYNAETSSSRSGWFGRRRKKAAPKKKKSKASKERENFKAIKELSEKEGITLIAAAALLEKKKELDSKRLKIIADKARIDAESREVDQQASQLAWEREWEEYKRGVPPREILRYNSLEITGGGIGLAIAAAVGGVAALPVGLIAGIVASKFIRLDAGWFFGINPKEVTNAAVNRADYYSENAFDSLATSKDEGRGLLIRRPDTREIKKDLKKREKAISKRNPKWKGRRKK